MWDVTVLFLIIVFLLTLYRGQVKKCERIGRKKPSGTDSILSQISPKTSVSHIIKSKLFHIEISKTRGQTV